jgi:repressor LexA
MTVFKFLLPSTMEKLTDRQTEIWRFIREYQETEGYPPTRAEIAERFGFRSLNAVTEHLNALARKGAIELAPDTSRGIRLKKLLQETPRTQPFYGTISEEAGLPVVGQVAAGSPLLAEQNITDRCRVDPGLFHPRADYLLRVYGLSMRDAGILDGDWLAVHATREARSGQIVVARIGSEVTVKRLWRKGERLELRPENPEFSPIVPDPERDELVIEGIAVGLIRGSGV